MKNIIRRVKEALVGLSSRGFRKAHAKVTQLNKPVKQKPDVNNLPIEVSVNQSKFYTHPKVGEGRKVYTEASDLPSGYAQDRLVLQVRDPWWIHAYWELTQSSLKRLKRELPVVSTGRFKKMLRVYDVSNIIFTGDNAHHFFDIEITPEANNWYIDTRDPGRSWCVDLGLLLENRKFITILRSNTVCTPLAGPSWITDEEWLIPEEEFRRLYGMGVGLGSSPLKLKKPWEERLKGEFGSWSLFSTIHPKDKERLS